MRKLYLTSIKLQFYIKTIRNSYVTQRNTHIKFILSRKNTVSDLYITIYDLYTDKDKNNVGISTGMEPV